MQSGIHSGDGFPSVSTWPWMNLLPVHAPVALDPRLSHRPRLLKALLLFSGKQLADWLLGSLSGEGNQMRWSSGPVNSDKTASGLRGQRPEVGLWATCQRMSSPEDPPGWNWPGATSPRDTVYRKPGGRENAQHLTVKRSPVRK